MTALVLIRHGQASFGQANYDKLSSLGELQASLTGRHLAKLGLRFDAMLSGDMVRQQDTGKFVRAAWDDAPPITVRQGFNEYDADGLFRAYLPRVLEEDSHLSERQRELFQDRKLFQRAFVQVTRKWLAGEEHEIESFEAWDAFRQRVRAELDVIRRDYGRDARIAVFTSGGPIAAAIAAALNLTPEMTMDLSWRIYNTGVSELRSTKHGWGLLGFNDITHLRLENDPALLTHR